MSSRLSTEAITVSHMILSPTLGVAAMLLRHTQIPKEWKR